MNTMNRVVLVILLLVAMVLCTVSLVVPLWVFDAVARQSVALLDYLNRLQWYVRLPLGILFALALDVIFVLLVALEMRRPASKAIRVSKTAGGEVRVGVASITDRLRYEIDQLSSVRRVVEEKMGLKLARPPKVNLRAVPYPRTPITPKTPIAPETSPPIVPED